MVLFSFLSAIICFNTIFDYEDTMQDIDNWLGDYILVGSTYDMRGVEPVFRFIYF